MDIVTDLKNRVVALEQIIKGLKSYDVVVTQNEDPDGLNRVKVECPEIYGISMESPWVADDTLFGGDETGSVRTPRIGDKVNIRLRDGNPDAPEYIGVKRSPTAKPPIEFENPKINGHKSIDGKITITENDEDGSYTVENEAGGKVFIDSEGNIHIYGNKFYTHIPSELNEGSSPVYGVVTTSPSFMCPFSGKPHRGSSYVKASD